MILVTGATGFLGSEVCKQLIVAGESVSALRRKSSIIPSILAECDINWIDSDLLDKVSLEKALGGITQIYHCAAFISFDPSDEENIYNVNVKGTENLVELCLQNFVRLVHVSSVAALGDAKVGELISETDNFDASNHTHVYGLSKLKAETIVWEGIKKGLKAVIVNPSIIIGANAGFNGSGAIFKLVKDGMPFYTRGSSGFVAVEDVAKCMLLLMKTDISGERFIISSENYNYKELFSAIAIGFNKQPPKFEASGWMLGLAWRMAKLISVFSRKSPGLTRESAKSSLNISLYSNQKIRSTIDITFKPIAESITEITKKLTLLG